MKDFCWMCFLSLTHIYVVLASLCPSVVSGGDRPGPFPHVVHLSWRAPQTNIRTFRQVAWCCMLTFGWNMRPAHFAPSCCEEGLWPVEGPTLDHPSYQQRGGGRARQDGRHYTAAVQWWSALLILLHLEPFATQTLLVAAAIATEKKGSFRWCTQNARHFHFLALNDCFLYLCPCLMQ